MCLSGVHEHEGVIVTITKGDSIMKQFIFGMIVGSVLTAGVGLTQVRSFDGLSPQFKHERFERQQLDLLREQNNILRRQQLQPYLTPNQPPVRMNPC